MSALLKSAWGLLLVASLVGNLALGVVNFVMQPVWRAAAVASAVAATKAQAEIAERKAVAKARSKEKAKARLRRVVVAIPIVGLAGAGAFEYAEFQNWHDENPDGSFQDYVTEVTAVTAEVSDEVLQELPERMRPEPRSLTWWYERISKWRPESEN